jgi:hypothetical protein
LRTEEYDINISAFTTANVASFEGKELQTRTADKKINEHKSQKNIYNI